MTHIHTPNPYGGQAWGSGLLIAEHYSAIRRFSLPDFIRFKRMKFACAYNAPSLALVPPPQTTPGTRP